jgi:hypothetical protein
MSDGPASKRHGFVHLGETQAMRSCADGLQRINLDKDLHQPIIPRSTTLIERPNLNTSPKVNIPHQSAGTLEGRPKVRVELLSIG